MPIKKLRSYSFKKRKNPLSFFKRLWRRVKIWFARVLPRRRFGEPFYKSRRLYAIVGGAAAAAVIIVGVSAAAISAEKEAKEAEAFRQAEAAAALAEEEEKEEPIYLYNGYEGEEVTAVQERLMELGYIDEDETTQLYGPATEQAVIRFQILNGLESDGIIENDDWDKLFSDDAAISTIAEGMSGDDIASYQSRLLNLGYLNASATGYFGTDTKSAVFEFQQKNGLDTTGVIDPETSEKLYSEDVVAKYLMYGMKSDAVAEVQQRLIDLGYLGGTADGNYGERTTEAVKLFQQKSGLVVDGYLGVETKTILMSENAQPNAFSVGDEGEAVTTLQEKLVQLNYIDKATGYFGSDTKEAVSNFQSNNGLTADGMAGALTLAKLYADDAVAGSSPVIVGRSSSIQNFIDVARTKLGCKYVLGAKGPSRFDCSGLVYWALNQVGINQSYVTSTVWRTVGNYTTIKDIDDVRAGDIICFTPHHVGIAVSSSTMIDASTSNGKVVERSFRTAYFERNFVCARRIF
jgi:peptidoglycan hydrolase-like protein with peptidoglycan-binding domain